MCCFEQVRLHASIEIAAALDVPVMLLDDIPGVSRKTATPAVLALLAHAQPLRIVKALASIDDKACGARFWA